MLKVRRMKKEALKISLLVLIVASLCACASIYTVRVNEGQKSYQAKNQTAGTERSAALLAEITELH